MRAPAILLAMALAACATRGSAFPILAPTQAADASADCAGLSGELERVAVLRREIAREQNAAGMGDVGNVVVSTAIAPAAGIVNGLLTTAGASSRNGRYDRAADAADRRMATLLALRADRPCSQREDERALAQVLRSVPERPREEREAAVAAFLKAGSS